MNRRLLFLCGMLAPCWFVFMTILGGAIRPGYSHLSDTVSELFAPGSPNKTFEADWTSRGILIHPDGMCEFDDGDYISTRPLGNNRHIRR
jgi:hypothetical protein